MPHGPRHHIGFGFSLIDNLVGSGAFDLCVFFYSIPSRFFLLFPSCGLAPLYFNLEYLTHLGRDSSPLIYKPLVPSGYTLVCLLFSISLDLLDPIKLSAVHSLSKNLSITALPSFDQALLALATVYYNT
ncbi:hypothetical protein MANI_023387 [Metarhizium anisopliae]|nr:hypothetical protein MANI_023387 [Metarhizium anisopliae]